jgi:hypothetical protein
MTEQLSIHKQRIRVGLERAWRATQRRWGKAPKPTPEHPLIISASELRDFLRCRVKWWWRHICRLEPAKDVEAMAEGFLGHQVLERWYGHPYPKRSKQLMKRIAPDICRTFSERQLSSESRELIEAMTIGYSAWTLDAANEDGDIAIGLQRCEPEEWFDLPLTPDGRIRVHGKIDTRFKPGPKRMACCEFKFKSSFRDEGVENMLQAGTYLWALAAKYPGQEQYTCYLTELRKQLPTARVTAPLFQRTPIERSAAEIAQWAKDAASAACDILDAAIYPSPHQSCQWECDFKTPCLERGTPELVQILREGYRVKPSRSA